MLNDELELRLRSVVAAGDLELFERWLIYLSREYGDDLGVLLLLKTDYFGHHTYSSILAYVAFHANHRLVARMINMIISQGFPINFQDENEDTALHYAVDANNQFAVSALLTTPGINPNIQGLNGLSPLMLAVSCGDVRLGVTRRLLASGMMYLALVDENDENVFVLADEAGKDVCALLYLYWRVGAGLFSMSAVETLVCEALLREYLVGRDIAMPADQVIDYLGDLLGLNMVDEDFNAMNRGVSSESIVSVVVPDVEFLGPVGQLDSGDHRVPDIDGQNGAGLSP